MVPFANGDMRPSLHTVNVDNDVDIMTKDQTYNIGVQWEGKLFNPVGPPLTNDQGSFILSNPREKMMKLVLM